MATAITWLLDFSGSPSPDDILAARDIVRRENERRTAENVSIAAENVRRAALTPPLSALPLLTILPVATGAQLKASYLSILLVVVTAAHADYINKAKTAAAVESQLTESQKQSLYSAIQTRLNNGETMDTILADVTS